MRIIKTLAIVAIALIATGLTGCKKQNPALEFVDIINNVTTEINKAQNLEQFEALDKQLAEGDEFVNQHADFELSESDKDAIAEALTSMLKASFAKQGEFNGIEIPEAQIDMYTQTLTEFIKKAKKLGDLNANQGDITTEEEFVETIEELPADSTVTAE